MDAPEPIDDDALDALLRRKGDAVTLGDVSRVLFGPEHGFDIAYWLAPRDVQRAEVRFDD